MMMTHHFCKTNVTHMVLLIARNDDDDDASFLLKQCDTYGAPHRHE